MMTAKQLLKLLCIATAGCVLSGAASAHHSQVLFDMTKCVTVSGTVRAWEFESPHSWLWIVTSNAKGETETWALESSSPAQMIEVEHRWKRDLVAKGDKVTARLSPLKDGRTGGALGWLTLPDGTTLHAATPACATAVPGAPTAAPAGAAPTPAASAPAPAAKPRH